jgi:hypothetical protein
MALRLPLFFHTCGCRPGKGGILTLDLDQNEGTFVIPFKCVDLASRIESDPTVEISRISPVVIVDLNK